MTVIYTLHAKDKLKRTDIRKFKITKKLIERIIKSPRSQQITKSGEHSAVTGINDKHDLRVIYDIMDAGFKVITFHISRKGRYP